MNVEQGLRFVAGVVILVSLSLALTLGKYWLILTAFAGLNLFQSGLTNWCPMVAVLKWLGLPACATPKIAGNCDTTG
jgi:hypothetical protein